MFDCEVIKRGRKAGGVTIETLLGVLLAVVVLFFVIGLFNDNLKNMLTNGSMSNIWTKTEKTTYNAFNKDYTNSQVNVQTLGEQGGTVLETLDDFINAAKAKAAYYTANPPQNEEQLEDLAKWLTILVMNGGAEARNTYGSLATTHGIDIIITYGQYITRVQTDNTTHLVINKQFEYAKDAPPRVESEKLAAAKEIYTAQYVPIPSP